jgi:hypothetical protein
MTWDRGKKQGEWLPTFVDARFEQLSAGLDSFFFRLRVAQIERSSRFGKLEEDEVAV